LGYAGIGQVECAATGSRLSGQKSKTGKTRLFQTYRSGAVRTERAHHANFTGIEWDGPLAISHTGDSELRVFQYRL